MFHSKWVLKSLGFLALLGFVGLTSVYWHFSKDLPDVANLEHDRPSQTTRLLSSDGTVIATLHAENRIWVDLDDMGVHLVPALLATEDYRFFSHGGLDLFGVGRAVYHAISSGEINEGASTVTMQLARSLFPMPRDHWQRKIRETLLSFRLERQFSKWELLELYLNQVYFGAGTYGVHAAARVYFDKTPDKLSLSEAALIVGLIQSPSRFCPLQHPLRAFHRQEEVLQRMLKVKGITQEQYATAIQERESMNFEGGESRAFEMNKFPYFTHYVVKRLSQRYSDQELYQGGLTVITSLDIDLQKKTQRILNEELSKRGQELDAETGATVVLESGSGFVKALVGGRGWKESDQFNRGVQAFRQPGSAFKPVIYACALRAGYTPQSTIIDSPVSYPDGSSTGWAPRNSDGTFVGLLTLRQALRDSRNVPAVKMMASLGPKTIIDLAHEMGIDSTIPLNLAVSLGAFEATPLEMASLYSVIANSGLRKGPVVVKLVENDTGQVMEDNRDLDSLVVLDPQVTAELTSILRDVVNSGTGTAAQVQGVPIAGKTGTTDAFRDAWFCGYSPMYTCVVWIGNDDNRPMRHSYGGDLPARIFSRVIEFSHRQQRPKTFPQLEPRAVPTRKFHSPPQPKRKESTLAPKSDSPVKELAPLPTPALLDDLE